MLNKNQIIIGCHLFNNKTQQVEEVNAMFLPGDSGKPCTINGNPLTDYSGIEIEKFHDYFASNFQYKDAKIDAFFHDSMETEGEPFDLDITIDRTNKGATVWYGNPSLKAGEYETAYITQVTDGGEMTFFPYIHQIEMVLHAIQWPTKFIKSVK